MGMGALHLSIPPRPSREDAIAVIHHALRCGITLLDTADCYCADVADTNHGEKLIRCALDSYGGDTTSVMVATKAGIVRPNGRWIPRGDPAYLEAAIIRGFDALGGRKPIDLWLLHTPDPNWPVKDSLRAAAAAVRGGLIRQVGLSNVSLDQIKEAQEVVEIAAIQNRYNLWYRDSEVNGVIAYCERTGMVFMPWSPLGGKQDHYLLTQIPFFQSLAGRYEVSVYAIALAWIFAKSPCMFPIPGTSRPQHVDSWIDALNLTLTTQDIYGIECSVFRAHRHVD